MTNDRNQTAHDEPAQVAALDRLLDDLHTGRPAFAGSLDEGLVATAKAVASLINPSAGADARVAADDMWERLMRDEARLAAPTARGARARLGIVASPLSHEEDRLHPFAALRLVAAIAAVVLLSVVSTSLYSELTTGQTTPTAMAAGRDTERTATVSAADAPCSTVTAVIASAVAPTSSVTTTGAAPQRSPTRETCTAD